MIYKLKGNDFWLDEAVDALSCYLKENNLENETVVCAAGMTPSAPIHFGILREIAISSFISDELTRRHIKNQLVYYWDDYDHFCKIPYYTTKEKVANYIGKPLCDVPDFNGAYESYGEHYMHNFEKCIHVCGFFPHYNYQSKLYKSGYYSDYIRKAVRNRKKIFDIVNHSKNSADEVYQKMRDAYFPLEIYCELCGKDNTAATDWNETEDRIFYTCKNCNHNGNYVIGENYRGKLAWKVNWAMRWADDHVYFESSGENQLTDTGSYSVSSIIALKIFNEEVPFSLQYNFIGIPGIAKVSRHQGERVLAEKITRVLEPPIIRWLLIKNPPNKPFSIDIDKGIFRIYHEWDEFCDKVESKNASFTEERIYHIAHQGVESSKIRIPFKTIVTAIGMSGGRTPKVLEMIHRISHVEESLEELFQFALPRIHAARYWIYNYYQGDEFPVLLETFNESAWSNFDEETKRMIHLVRDCADSLTNEENVKEVLFSIPQKIRVPSEQAAAVQKKLFSALYAVLFGTNHGPKLTTIFCLINKEKINTLLTGGSK